MAEINTQFNYLLNAYTQAAQHDKPASVNYADKRRALIEHVRGLEAKAAQLESLRATSQPVGVPEPMIRFCPGCGSVGEVEAKYRDCCPDGSGARMIPEKLARKCHDLFQLALRAPSDHELTASPTPPAAPARITIKAPQLRQALEFVNPDAGDIDQQEDDLSIGWVTERIADGEVHPAGLYAWFTDLPDEGSVYLDATPTAAGDEAGKVGG